LAVEIIAEQIWAENKMATTTGVTVLRIANADGDPLGDPYPLAKSEIFIGRDAKNDLVLDDDLVAPRHALIRYNVNQWEITNLSDAALIYHNDQPLARDHSAPLKLSDKIGLGSWFAEVGVEQVQPTAAAAPASLTDKSGGDAQPKIQSRHTAPVNIVSSPAADAGEPIVQEKKSQLPLHTADHAAENQPADAIPGRQAEVTIPSVEPPPGVPSNAPQLFVMYGGKRQVYALVQDCITIGRSDEANIIIPVNTVSALHAILQRTPDGTYALIDQNSTNGLYYKGRRVKQVEMRHGEIVRISDSIGNYITLSYSDPAGADRARRSYQLDKDSTVIRIGRAPGNDVVISNPLVSSYHAIIRRRGDEAYLEDLGSAYGTYLNDKRLRRYRPVRIEEGIVFRVANQLLVYRDPESLDQPEKSDIRLDAVSLGKKIGKVIILNDISISIQPREFVAIVGGSGAGKSTLLDALNGFRPAPTGRVMLNGDDYYRNYAYYRSNLGYVPQEDIIHRSLPVETALFYVAKLRLPKDTSNKEIRERIGEVLEAVDMTEQRNVIVNNLSGGQRKRVSIAVELLANPGLFFLDEPTSGLDPGLEKRMMFMLRRLADEGRTILLITHATANISICDKIVFLGTGGRLCFYGTPREALQFFDVNEFADIYSLIEDADESAEWEARYKTSPYYQTYITEKLGELPPEKLDLKNKKAFANDEIEYPKLKVSGWRQYFILSRRYLNLIVRDPLNLLVLLAQAPIIGLILAQVAGSNIFANGASPANAMQVMFILAVSSVWLGTNNAAREIAKESPIYRRERLVNLRVFPYIMSKVTVLAFLCLIQSVSLVLIMTYASGTPPNPVFFMSEVELIICVWLTTLGGMAMGLMISAMVSNTDKATSLVPIILVPQIILGGIIFPLEGDTEFLGWVTVSKWSTDSLGTSADINRLFYQRYGDLKPGEKSLITTYDPENYDDNPTARKYPPLAPKVESFESRQYPLLSRWGILFGQFVLFIILACFFQKRKDRAWSRR
jgi:ABC transport system ATP-binding/permease protein